MPTPGSDARQGPPRGGHDVVHSEARGPHWVAWVARDGGTKPDRSVILVAASKEEAEARARRWAEQNP